MTSIRAYLSGEKIVFFGAGQYSLSLITLLYDKIAYFIDNAPSKQVCYFGEFRSLRLKNCLKRIERRQYENANQNWQSASLGHEKE